MPRPENMASTNVPILELTSWKDKKHLTQRIQSLEDHLRKEVQPLKLGVGLTDIQLARLLQQLVSLAGAVRAWLSLYACHDGQDALVVHWAILRLFPSSTRFKHSIGLDGPDSRVLALEEIIGYILAEGAGLSPDSPAAEARWISILLASEPPKGMPLRQFILNFATFISFSRLSLEVASQNTLISEIFLVHCYRHFKGFCRFIREWQRSRDQEVPTPGDSVAKVAPALRWDTLVALERAYHRLEASRQEEYESSSGYLPRPPISHPLLARVVAITPAIRSDNDILDPAGADLVGEELDPELLLQA